MTDSVKMPEASVNKMAIDVAKNLLTILLGVLCYTFGWTAFILSQEITTGGLAGISTIIQIATDIPANIPYNIINFSLLIPALLFLGWKFTLNTVTGVALLGIIFPVGQALFTPKSSEVYKNLLPFLKEYIPNVGLLDITTKEPFVALVLGAVLCGLGLGLVFSVNGSTGGTDVIVAVLNKYKDMSLGRAMVVVDSLIVIIGCLVSHYAKDISWPVALTKLAYSIVEVVVVSITLDFYLNSNKQSVQLFISSSKYEEINHILVKDFNKGCTILEARGGFTNQSMPVLMVVVRKRMRNQVMDIISNIDPKAFVSEGVVHGVYGEGFDKHKQKK